MAWNNRNDNFIADILLLFAIFNYFVFKEIHQSVRFS